MQAMLVIRTKNGYAVAPYSGAVPESFVGDMSVATAIKSYSFGESTVCAELLDYFEPKPAEVKEAA